MREILLQNATPILLQNATAILLLNSTEVYYKMHKVFYYKMQQLLQTVTILLQNATVITKCDVYYKLQHFTASSFNKFWYAKVLSKWT